MQRKTAFWVVALCLGLALPAAGSTFVAMDEEELLLAADAVVRGEVVSVESFWNDRHTLILTEAVFRVESVVVGAAPPFVTLRTAGGTVDGETVEAVGFPTFEAGERALLFLQRDDDKPMGRVHIGGRPEGYRVAGYQLGHYLIARDREGKPIAVPTADPGMELVSAAGRRPEAPRVRRLGEFETSLRRTGERLGRVVPQR